MHQLLRRLSTELLREGGTSKDAIEQKAPPKEGTELQRDPKGGDSLPCLGLPVGMVLPWILSAHPAKYLKVLMQPSRSMKKAWRKGFPVSIVSRVYKDKMTPVTHVASFPFFWEVVKWGGGV